MILSILKIAGNIKHTPLQVKMTMMSIQQCSTLKNGTKRRQRNNI